MDKQFYEMNQKMRDHFEKVAADVRSVLTLYDSVVATV
jgi:hypothetical protein